MPSIEKVNLGATDTATSKSPLRVAFHCLRAYGLFDTSSRRIFGGAEVRARFFALELSRRESANVSFFVEDEGQLASQTIGTLNVVVDPNSTFLSERFFDVAYAGYLEACNPQSTFPYFRVHTWRAGLVWQIPALALHRLLYSRLTSRSSYKPRIVPFYREQGFDAYCLFHINETTANVIATCKQVGGPKTAMFLIHDDDVSPDDPARTTVRSFALRNADLIVAQTHHQADQLCENFQRNAVVIRNPMEMSIESINSNRERNIALWIGRAQKLGSVHKRPELLFYIARQCPHIQFVAIINTDDPVRFRSLMQERPDNVEVIEKIPFSEMDSVFGRTRVFISTSGTEGFPNTFLQAGKHGIPIVSLTVDPEGMLSRHASGIACDSDIDKMAKELTRLWSDSIEREKLGKNARDYVAQYHDIRRSGDALEATLRTLVAAE